MGDVTRILADIERGDPHAAGQLLPLVYEELRELAADPLAREDPEAAELVKLRAVAGLTLG